MAKVYVLKLENNKYYVGFSEHIKERIKRHFSGTGSSWTRLHKPVEVLGVYPVSSDVVAFKEKQMTVLCMAKYGWKSVRGYCWSMRDEEEVRNILCLQEEFIESMLAMLCKDVFFEDFIDSEMDVSCIDIRRFGFVKEENP